MVLHTRPNQGCRAVTATAGGVASAPWVPTLDDDNDPIYGDLGKVDTLTGEDDGGQLCYMDDDSYK